MTLAMIKEQGQMSSHLGKYHIAETVIIFQDRQKIIFLNWEQNPDK